jgi:uncharacterized membrane protein
MQGKLSGLLVVFALLAVLVTPMTLRGQERERNRHYGDDRERESRFATIDIEGADKTYAAGINPRGDIVGFYHLRGDTTDANYGFFLGKRGLVDINYPGSVSTSAMAINSAGDIVGGYRDSLTGPTHGYLLRKGRFTPIDVPGATFTLAYDINSEGDIVGHLGAPSGWMNVFLWRHGHFTTYAHPLAEAARKMTCGFGINSQGQIVGHYVDGNGKHGFLLDEEGWTSLDVAGWKALDPQGINSEGEIVGVYTDIVTNKFHGFFRDEHGAFEQIDVPVAGATDTWARKINPRGDMVGEYKDGTGTHGFLMRR